jgi:hypothetical protein
MKFDHLCRNINYTTICPGQCDNDLNFCAAIHILMLNHFEKYKLNTILKSVTILLNLYFTSLIVFTGRVSKH